MKILGPRALCSDPERAISRVRWFVISPRPDSVPKPLLGASMHGRFAEFDGAGHIIDQTRHPGMHETHSIDIIWPLQGVQNLQ